MRANQTMVASDGYEVALFFFPYLYMSQDEGGDYSHINTYNIDFLGWGANGRVYHCPYYAPCTLKCVARPDDSTHARVYESVNKVHLADGSLDYLTLDVAHDDNPPHNIGDIIQQGALLGRTGTTGQGVTGDHVHSCCGKGRYVGFTQRTGGHWDLTNRTHFWNALYTNDTTIVQGYGHNWHSYIGPTPPTPPTPTHWGKSKFPWVLYARKLRNKRL